MATAELVTYSITDADRVEHERIAAIKREERLEAMKPDLQKLALFSAKLSNLTAPAMKTPTGQSIATAVTNSLGRVVQDLDAALKGAA